MSIGSFGEALLRKYMLPEKVRVMVKYDEVHWRHPARMQVILIEAVLAIAAALAWWGYAETTIPLQNILLGIVIGSFILSMLFSMKRKDYEENLAGGGTPVIVALVLSGVFGGLYFSVNRIFLPFLVTTLLLAYPIILITTDVHRAFEQARSGEDAETRKEGRKLLEILMLWPGWHWRMRK